MRDSEYKLFEAKVKEIMKQCVVNPSIGMSEGIKKYGKYKMEFCDKTFYYSRKAVDKQKKELKKLYENRPIQRIRK